MLLLMLSAWYAHPCCVWLWLCAVVSVYNYFNGPFYFGWSSSATTYGALLTTDNAAGMLLLDDLGGLYSQPQFGSAVAVNRDGSVFAVAALQHNPHDPQPGGGAVYIFVTTLSPVLTIPYTYVQQPVLTAALAGFPAGELASFGSALAMSANGDTLAVGACTASERGAVRVFQRDYGASGSQQQWRPQSAILTPADSDAAVNSGALFGQSVSLTLDGNWLVVGAPGAAGSTGFMYTYRRAGGVWSVQPTLRPPSISFGAGVRFGFSVVVRDPFSSNDPVLVVGAPGDGSTQSGAIYQYRWIGYASEWVLTPNTQRTPADADGNEFNFGYALAMNDNATVLLGRWCSMRSLLQ